VGFIISLLENGTAVKHNNKSMFSLFSGPLGYVDLATIVCTISTGSPKNKKICHHLPSQVDPSMNFFLMLNTNSK